MTRCTAASPCCAGLLLLLTASLLCVVHGGGSLLHFNSKPAGTSSDRPVVGWGSPRPTHHAPWAHANTEEEVRGGRFEAMKARVAEAAAAPRGGG
eukprot:CAMPEP_0206239342 /NCGR_PEP_ID=MMETSP0047_2-20121206/15327_1 /ASSEMBLY_ACC=CAM_ASM_000192 /TAXON_ID=195065 /ORGANISM="Chroomonas mesostigmatica_cf, Strain CCMP1168" /LENGTH=94 /DNA_ID=CAMNT_0053663997 /DNA_START=129 /DNA_END=410 /DNA_ORIENTATION=+